MIWAKFGFHRLRPGLANRPFRPENNKLDFAFPRPPAALPLPAWA